MKCLTGPLSGDMSIVREGTSGTIVKHTFHQSPTGPSNNRKAAAKVWHFLVVSYILSYTALIQPIICIYIYIEREREGVGFFWKGNFRRTQRVLYNQYRDPRSSVYPWDTYLSTVYRNKHRAFMSAINLLSSMDPMDSYVYWIPYPPGN